MSVSAGQQVVAELRPGERVAIVRLRSMGDCVLTTPAIEILRQTRPDVRIGVVVEPRFAGVFEDNPAVEAILRPSVAAIARYRPRLCVNFHGGTRSLLVTAVSLARYRAGFAHHQGAWVYNIRIPRAQEILGEERGVHTAEHLASAMFYLGCPAREIPPARLYATPVATGEPYAVVHARAAMAYKTWAPENFVAVARHIHDRYGLEPVFIGAAQDDMRAFGGFRQMVGAPLGKVKNLIAGATLFVGNDSGPAHVAAAFGVPVVVLYGRREHTMTFGPWKARAARALVSDAGIQAIRVEEVLAAVEEVMGEWDHRQPGAAGA